MKISSVEFVKSVVDVKNVPKDNLKEVAFAGRSNVGKSTLINCLINRKKLVKTSSTPGKTRQLNFFRINQRFYFVDLPGYGFAKVSKQERQRWQKLIENYLTNNSKLSGVVSIIDMRLGPTKLDLQLLEWLNSFELPVILVATKSDKLSKSRVTNQLRKYNKEASPYINDQIVPFSAVNGNGKKELWHEIGNLME